MICPHCCNQPTRVRATGTEVGLVIRVRRCSKCRRQYRTEERCVEEIQIPKKQNPTPEQRKAERELWHQQRWRKT